MTKLVFAFIAAAAIGIVAGIAAGFDPKDAPAQNGGMLGATSGPDNYTPYFFYNGLYGKLFSQGGGVDRFTATTTQNARSLTQALLSANSTFEILATSSPALSITIPATSTWTTLLPKPGDIRTWFFDNQQAAATTTTFVAGAGIDLVAATVNDDVIDGQEIAQLTCWRKFNTDIYCLTSEILKAD